MCMWEVYLSGIYQHVKKYVNQLRLMEDTSGRTVFDGNTPRVSLECVPKAPTSAFCCSPSLHGPYFGAITPHILPAAKISFRALIFIGKNMTFKLHLLQFLSSSCIGGSLALHDNEKAYRTDNTQ